MKKLLAALLAVATFGCGAKESEYHGKTVSVWVQELDQGPPAGQAAAANLLTEVGKVDPSALRSLTAGVKNGSFGAADVLGKIGTSAANGQTKECVVALAEGMKMKGNARNSLRLACARAVPRFGKASKEAVPALLEMLRDEDPIMRAQAAKTLGQMPPEAAQEAVNALLLAARTDQAPDVQLSATEAIRALDPAALEQPKGKP